MWMPGVFGPTPTAPKWMFLCANWTDANHAAGEGPKHGDEEDDRPVDEDQADHDQHPHQDSDLRALPVFEPAVSPPPLAGKTGPAVVPGVPDFVHDFSGVSH